MPPYRAYLGRPRKVGPTNEDRVVLASDFQALLGLILVPISSLSDSDFKSGLIGIEPGLASSLVSADRFRHF